MKRGTLPCSYCGCSFVAIQICHRYGEQFYYAICVICRRESSLMDCTDDAVDHWNMLQKKEEKCWL